MLDTTRTVKDIALEMPAATRIFEKLGIDYCCGGSKTLVEACRASGVALAEVESSLARAAENQEAATLAPNFLAMSLSDLINHIVSTHHVFTRDELIRLEKLMDKVCSVHGGNHAELLRMQSLLRDLKNDLEPHLFKEENVLFPYIVKLEQSSELGVEPPRPPFGTAKNPIRMMMMEHDVAGDILRTLRETSSGYQVPADGCISYQTLYRALENLEADLHQHIHLENNLLFPRAVELEDRL